MPHFSDKELKTVQEKTFQIEEEREARRLEKEQLKKLKEKKRIRERRERLIAPVLLIFTILLTLILGLIF